MYIVELERGVWLADGEGDPPRTLVKENAKPFKTARAALTAIDRARTYRPFPQASANKVVNP